MNKWKIAFISLVCFLIIVIIGIILLVTSPTKQQHLLEEPKVTNGSVLTIQTTTDEFEQIAIKYLDEAIKNSPVGVEIAIDEQIYLFAKLKIFDVPLPMQMDFTPEVVDGNILMKQTKVHVGKLNIPPATVLKMLNDSVDFPSWITVRPNQEEIYIDLSRLNIADGNRVRAKEINLKQDKILLELIIPTK